MVEDLVDKARDGNAESFAALVERFRNMAMGYAYWFCDDFHLAEDIVQNAFFEAYRELHKLRQSAAFPGWFRKILNKNCDRLTRSRRKPTLSLSVAGGLAAPDPTPFESAETREKICDLRRAMLKLPEGERMVVSLYYMSEYSQKEVAEFIGVPVSTVNNRLYSARKRLKERLHTMAENTLKEHALPRDFGKDFNPALAKALELCAARFGDDLEAVYLTGSIAAGEALVDASDVNWFMFLGRDVEENDTGWCREQERKLKEQFPNAQSYVLCLFSLDRLRKESFWRFILRYNSVLLHGKDILSVLEEEGLETPRPTKELAQNRLWFAEECIESAVQGKLTTKLFVLPVNPFWATRKLARYFVVVEGAYVLMAEGKFSTFHERDVMGKLKRSYSQWADLFATTEAVVKDPVKANILPQVFVEQVAPFVRWAIEHVREA
ncbi:RNA polymerase sigma factor [Candidatus Hydrogenedentota bacterium]